MASPIGKPSSNAIWPSNLLSSSPLEEGRTHVRHHRSRLQSLATAGGTASGLSKKALVNMVEKTERPPVIATATANSDQSAARAGLRHQRQQNFPSTEVVETPSPPQNDVSLRSERRRTAMPVSTGIHERVSDSGRNNHPLTITSAPKLVWSEDCSETSQEGNNTRGYFLKADLEMTKSTHSSAGKSLTSPTSPSLSPRQPDRSSAKSPSGSSLPEARGSNGDTNDEDDDIDDDAWLQSLLAIGEIGSGDSMALRPEDGRASTDQHDNIAKGLGDSLPICPRTPMLSRHTSSTTIPPESLLTFVPQRPDGGTVHRRRKFSRKAPSRGWFSEQPPGGMPSTMNGGAIQSTVDHMNSTANHCCQSYRDRLLSKTGNGDMSGTGDVADCSEGDSFQRITPLEGYDESDVPRPRRRGRAVTGARSGSGQRNGTPIVGPSFYPAALGRSRLTKVAPAGSFFSRATSCDAPPTSMKLEARERLPDDSEEAPAQSSMRREEPMIQHSRPQRHHWLHEAQHKTQQVPTMRRSNDRATERLSIGRSDALVKNGLESAVHLRARSLAPLPTRQSAPFVSSVSPLGSVDDNTCPADFEEESSSLLGTSKDVGRARHCFKGRGTRSTELRRLRSILPDAIRSLRPVPGLGRPVIPDVTSALLGHRSLTTFGIGVEDLKLLCLSREINNINSQSGRAHRYESGVSDSRPASSLPPMKASRKTCQSELLSTSTRRGLRKRGFTLSSSAEPCAQEVRAGRAICDPVAAGVARGPWRCVDRPPGLEGISKASQEPSCDAEEMRVISDCLSPSSDSLRPTDIRPFSRDRITKTLTPQQLEQESMHIAFNASAYLRPQSKHHDVHSTSQSTTSSPRCHCSHERQFRQTVAAASHRGTFLRAIPPAPSGGMCIARPPAPHDLVNDNCLSPLYPHTLASVPQLLSVSRCRNASTSTTAGPFGASAALASLRALEACRIEREREAQQKVQKFKEGWESQDDSDECRSTDTWEVARADEPRTFKARSNYREESIGSIRSSLRRLHCDTSHIADTTSRRESEGESAALRTVRQRRFRSASRGPGKCPESRINLLALSGGSGHVSSNGGNLYEPRQHSLRPQMLFSNRSLPALIDATRRGMMPTPPTAVLHQTELGPLRPAGSIFRRASAYRVDRETFSRQQSGQQQDFRDPRRLTMSPRRSKYHSPMLNIHQQTSQSTADLRSKALQALPSVHSFPNRSDEAASTATTMTGPPSSPRRPLSGPLSDTLTGPNDTGSERSFPERYGSTGTERRRAFSSLSGPLSNFQGRYGRHGAGPASEGPFFTEQRVHDAKSVSQHTLAGRAPHSRLRQKCSARPVGGDLASHSESERAMLTVRTAVRLPHESMQPYNGSAKEQHRQQGIQHQQQRPPQSAQELAARSTIVVWPSSLVKIDPPPSGEAPTVPFRAECSL